MGTHWKHLFGRRRFLMHGNLADRCGRVKVADAENAPCLFGKTTGQGREQQPQWWTDAAHENLSNGTPTPPGSSQQRSRTTMWECGKYAVVDHCYPGLHEENDNV